MFVEIQPNFLLFILFVFPHIHCW